jgi:hypothetical protein
MAPRGAGTSAAGPDAGAAAGRASSTAIAGTGSSADRAGGRSGGAGGRSGGSAAGPDAPQGGMASEPPSEASICAGAVGAVPEDVRKRLDLDPFYEKYLDADGVPILASSAPDDRALGLACELVHEMLGEREDVKRALIASGARFVIIGRDEGTAEIPEYGYRSRPQSERDAIDERARGLGGLAASCGEENILCQGGDRYRGESICIHEFSHTISIYGLYAADRDFEERLRTTFDSAQGSGILDGTYRLENEQEYWAEGVQDWYGSNSEANPPNGIHNSVDTRDELRDYDRALYDLVDELLPSELNFADCNAVGGR